MVRMPPTLSWAMAYLAPRVHKWYLGAVRSGVFGQQSELLTGAVAQQVLSAVSSLLSNIGGEGSSGNLESTLDESMSRLSESERARLDSIVQELAQRSIERATRRLEDVSRIIG